MFCSRAKGSLSGFALILRPKSFMSCTKAVYNALSLELNEIFNICNEKEVFKFKSNYKIANFQTQFCLGSSPNGFSNTESREVSLNGNLYDFIIWLQFY